MEKPPSPKPETKTTVSPETRDERVSKLRATLDADLGVVPSTKVDQSVGDRSKATPQAPESQSSHAGTCPDTKLDPTTRGQSPSTAKKGNYGSDLRTEPSLGDYKPPAPTEEVDRPVSGKSKTALASESQDHQASAAGSGRDTEFGSTISGKSSSETKKGDRDGDLRTEPPSQHTYTGKKFDEDRDDLRTATSLRTVPSLESRTHRSAGEEQAAKRAGLKNRLKGEVKVIAGKLSHDQEKVDEGKRLKAEGSP